jgi:predicted aspartyl protease
MVCLRGVAVVGLILGVGVPAQAGELDTRVPLRDNGIATFYVEGHIHGVGVIDLLVDTGAGYTAINERTITVLKRKGLATYIKDMGARLADGSRRVVSIYRISRLNIGGACEIRDVEVAVLPSGSRSILGLGTLKRVAPFMVSLDPPSLSLSHCRSPRRSVVAAVQ